MLTYSLENIGSDSLYEYIYKCIKNDILSGVLSPDYKLPSKRTFAKNLGVSTITIENAYEQLMAEGYIYSMPKKGYYISDISSTFQFATIAPSYIPAPRNESTISTVSTPSDSSMNISSNYMNTDNFPFYTWAKLMKNVMSDKHKELLEPSPVGGILLLRQAIANHLYDFRGMSISPEQIIVGAGTEYLYSLLIQLLGQDKTFAVEDPGYSKIRMIYESNGVRCQCIPMDQDGINIKSLRVSDADILHLSPSHHYPTGIVTPVSRRYELLGWASEKLSRYIIEDDYDSEFRLLGRPIPSLQSIDAMGRVIYMNTFTKSLSPTIRISYMILPPALLKLFKEKLSFYSCTVSNFDQYTLAQFLREGHFEKHINRMRIFYRKQRDTLIKAIESSPLSDIITIQEKDAGLHFLMHVTTPLTDEAIIKRAHDNGLSLSCLSQYYYDKTNAITNTIIINYSAIDPARISEAVVLLCQCLL